MTNCGYCNAEIPYEGAIHRCTGELLSSCPSCSRADDTQGLARAIGIGLLKFTGIMSLSGGEWEKSIAKDVQRFIRKGGIDSLRATLEERDAYKKAKQENDERFMLERDAALEERDNWIKYHDSIAAECKKWRKDAQKLFAERDAALARITAPIVCICGSTRFKQSWIAENARLTGEGNIVLAVGLWGHHERVFPDAETKEKLDGLHLRKIDLCDWVWVLDVGGYIGESTKNEIAYAEAHGKLVRYLSKENPGYVEPVDPLTTALSRAEEAERQLCAARDVIDKIKSVRGPWHGLSIHSILSGTAFSSSSPCPHEAERKLHEERIRFMRDDYSRYGARGCQICLYENGKFIRLCKLHQEIDRLNSRIKQLEGHMDCITSQVATGECPHEGEAERLRKLIVGLDWRSEEIPELKSRIRELEEAVEWACGNGNYNPQIQPGDCLDKSNYANNEWWKAELRRRAGAGKE